MIGADPAWRVERLAGIGVLRCALLDGADPWVHAFTTRRGPGGVDFDLRREEDGGGPVAADRRRDLLAAVGLAGARLVEVRQVHGARVVPVGEVASGTEGDGIALVEAGSGIAAGIRSADCVPVLLAAPGGRCGAAVHAGWRGVAARVVPAAVRTLAGAGCPPGRVRAAVGPSIGPCCYRVDAACAAAVARSAPGAGLPDGDPVVIEAPDGPRLSLRAAVVRQLVEAGIDAGSVAVAPWCTRCSPALWFSHRGEGAGAGRMLAVLGLPQRGGRP